MSNAMRNKAVVVFLAATLWASQLPAQAPTHPDARTLLKLEDEWAAALVRRDRAVFERLLAPEFVYTENGETLGRDEVLRALVDEDTTIEAARNEDLEVHRFGKTAVVTGWLAVRGRKPGGPFDIRYRFTDVWVRRGKRWQIVAAHDYLAAGGP